MSIRILYSFFAILPYIAFSTIPLYGQTAQRAYIAQYADIAVRERERTGVPASITLAQGMLESANGKSVLAVRGNNHFGIKCHEWKGARMYHNDDRRHECFRKYRNAEESFRDHSDFLRYRDRYKFLFSYKVTDYKAWAYGLKKAGYATDPAYPAKLIKLIEEYNLVKYDLDGSSVTVSKRPRPARHPKNRPEKDRGGRHKTGKGNTSSGEQVSVPVTPMEAEQPKLLSDDEGRSFNLSLTRQLYSQNGVKFIYSVQGDTYASIASRYNLFLSEVLKFNDLDADCELMPGTVVYLQRKKAKAAKLVLKYVAEGGETLRDISQRYAVRMKNLMKLNGLGADAVLSEGDMILLRNK